MILFKFKCDSVKKRHYIFWIIVAGITSGEKNTVKPRAFLIKFSMSLHLGFKLSFVRQVNIGRSPDPIIKPVIIAYFAHPAIHLFAWHFHIRPRRIILEWDIFNTVCSKQCKLAYVLFKLVYRPCIPGVSRVAIAELVPADWIHRRCSYLIYLIE